MANQRILYTEEMVGDNHPTKTDTLNRFINIITTQGDLLYGTAAATADRLAKGAANTTLFMNAAATAPEWAFGVYIGTFTRDMTAASGDVAYTGVGFKPSAVILLATVDGAPDDFSVGFDVGGTKAMMGQRTVASIQMIRTPNYSIIIEDATGDSQKMLIKTRDADGFTGTWTKDGTPTATITVHYLAFR